MAAIVGTGGTISHHHGVGTWHAPWLEAEVGPAGRAIMEEASRILRDAVSTLPPPVVGDRQLGRIHLGEVPGRRPGAELQ